MTSELRIRERQLADAATRKPGHPLGTDFRARPTPEEREAHVPGADAVNPVVNGVPALGHGCFAAEDGGDHSWNGGGAMKPLLDERKPTL